ncbi:MAG: GFA family protein [Acidobacteriota bacterium]|nr:MAG: GFA family protein [Acidobacteriota bacterium]
MGKADDILTGSCLCGAVTFEIETPTSYCCHCHCSNCRRAHGAAFVTWLGFDDEDFRLTSNPDDLVNYHTDTGATRSFCRKCGTTLFYKSPRWEGENNVALGNVHGEADRVPEHHMYVDHKAKWHQITDSLPQKGGETGEEPKARPS